MRASAGFAVTKRPSTVVWKIPSPAFPAALRLPELPLDGGVEPGEVVLHYIVLRPGLHRRHRDVLTYVAADDNERQIREALAPEQLQRRQRAEGRHGVVCDHEVPLPLVESGLHGPRGVDPLADGIVPATPQLPQEEQGVVFVVLDDQYS